MLRKFVEFVHFFPRLPERSSPADAEVELGTVAEEIEASLGQEARWMEKEYEELLKQYSHEQSLHSQSHSLTLKEFRHRINSILQQNKCQVRRFDFKDRAPHRALVH